MRKLYFNGNIITMEKDMYAEAVVTEDGIIKYAGALNGVQVNNAEKIDLQGKTMMPSFIDPHSHFSACAQSFIRAALDESVNFNEIKEKIKLYIKENKVPEGEWVTAEGYDHNLLEEKKHPPKELLDEAAPNNPLVIQHKSGHAGVFNSAALKMLGITNNTPDVEGGIIGRENGVLTGYMEEKAFIGFLRRVPMASFEEMMQAYRKAQLKYASYGITTVQEGMMVPQMEELYKYLLDENILKIDVVGYAASGEGEHLFETFGEHVKTYIKHFKLGGYKMFLDGSPQARTAWMTSPYQNSDYCGYPILDNMKVEKFIKEAAERKMQILAHCNGDAACEQYINAYEAVLKKEKKAEFIRPVIIHAQLMTEKQIERAVNLGMIPSFFIGHIYYWGDVHIKNFGRKRAEKISCASAAVRESGIFTLHQDTPVTEPNMLHSVWCAVNRITKSGIRLGEPINVENALKAVTINAAYQYFEENEKGSIKKNKNADFVILSDNPFTVNSEDIKDIKILETIKNDEKIFEI